MVMSDLSEAILTRLKDRGFDVNEISFLDLIDGRINLTRPAANITFNNSTVQKVTVNTYKFKVAISLLLVVNWLKGGSQGDAQRKAKVYDLIESASAYLTLQDFELPLENPLYPTGFRNITTAKLAKAGYQLYTLDFWCAWNSTKEEMYKDSLTLESILAQYTLVPGVTGAEPPQGSDIINVGS